MLASVVRDIEQLCSQSLRTNCSVVKALGSVDIDHQEEMIKNTRDH